MWPQATGAQKNWNGNDQPHQHDQPDAPGAGAQVYRLAAAAAAAAAGVDGGAAAANAAAAVYASQGSRRGGGGGGGGQRQQYPRRGSPPGHGHGQLAGKGAPPMNGGVAYAQPPPGAAFHQPPPQAYLYHQQQQHALAPQQAPQPPHPCAGGVAPQLNGYHPYPPAMAPPHAAPGGWAPPPPAPGPPHAAPAPPHGGGLPQKPGAPPPRGGGAGRGGPGGGGGRGQAHGGRGGRKWKPGGSAEGGDAAADSLIWSIRRAPAGQLLDGGSLQQLLSGLDSRGMASVLKELSRGQAGGGRAREVFEWLCALPPPHPLARLCDVFTFTAMVALCVEGQELARAMGLVEEMRARGIQRNVHTYSALMNVCIKCGQLQQALSVYRTMLAEGISPNVVTYNTLIDVYGKTGQWAEALGVLRQMEAEGTKPVTRTYNTLMIACNASGQWQDALNVYDSMLRAGHAPNTTTYNALISAHSRAGSLERVMDTFRDMVRSGCERSVITYSALISACEKAGQWQTALDLFSKMTAEGCAPNVITYNSLITACGQGAQWQRAADVFAQMQRSGCRPDVVTYTALIGAYERGGEWLRALETFRLMQDKGCMPDSILYSALLDALWDTGIAWAQAKAAGLYRQAAKQGHFRKLPDLTGPKCELPLQQLSPGLAMLALHCWLADLGALAESRGAAALPASLCISLGRSRQRDPTAAVVRDSVCALLRSHGSPFAPPAPDAPAAAPAGGGTASNHSSPRSKGAGSAVVAEGEGKAEGRGADGKGGSGSGNGGGQGTAASNRLEASGADVAAWLQQEHVRHALDTFAAAAAGAGTSDRSTSACPDLDAGDDAVAASEAEAGEDLAHMERERAAERRARDAFSAVAHFEATRCLSVQRMGAGYLAARPALAARGGRAAGALGAPLEAAHDAVLLLDRWASTGAQLEDLGVEVALAACLYLVLLTTPGLSEGVTRAQVAEAAGADEAAVAEAEAAARAALTTPEFPDGDLEAISALRVLDLYSGRLAGPDAHAHARPAGPQAARGGGEHARQIICAATDDPEFLNYRPSITAAAAVYVSRVQRGRLPFWPTSLAALTSYSDGSTPELAAAIRGAHRLARAAAAPAAAAAAAGAAAAGPAAPEGGAPGAPGAEPEAPAAAAEAPEPPAAGAAEDGGAAAATAAEEVAAAAAATAV